MVNEISFLRIPPTTFVTFPARQGERRMFIADWWRRREMRDDDVFLETWIGISHETLHFVLTEITDADDPSENWATDGIDRDNINLDIEIGLEWRSIQGYFSPLS
jgi:hypothetical protein